MSEPYITLRQALESGRLGDFIDQAEAAGVGPAPESEVDTALARVIKQPRSEGQTSRSPSPDGSTGKRTR
jgi:hypothetical protein